MFERFFTQRFCKLVASFSRGNDKVFESPFHFGFFNYYKLVSRINNAAITSNFKPTIIKMILNREQKHAACNQQSAESSR